MTKYTRRFLRVNLSSREISIEAIGEDVVMNFIGGRGFGINYLYQELSPGIDPLGEHNKLLLLTGVLAGTSAQSVSRWMVCTNSPLTGGFARAVSGGDFGAWLKFAGYDFILVEGKAETPVYIYLNNNGCQIHGASELWGKDTMETQEWLSQRYGKHTRVACIGPAGESLVRYASIVTGRRTASRCGVGTVMGAMKLKAIAITAQRNVNLYDPQAFKEIVKEQVNFYHNSYSYQHHREMGTTDMLSRMNNLGVLPVRNFRFGQQIDTEKLSGQEYRKLRTGEFGCYSCSARCGKIHRVSAGQYAGAYSHGPEYETIWAFTGPIDNTNIEATIAADQLCDDLGLDTISTGNSIGFAYELYEKGILTQKDTDGLELTYGNHSPILALIKKIAWREGIGNILAEGSMRAAASIGKEAEAYTMHVKGMELPGYEPRGAKAMGFNYATASVGASHACGYAGQEIFGTPIPREVDRFTEADKADIVIYNQDKNAMCEVGIACTFSTAWGWFPNVFGRMIAAATGINQFADTNYLWKVGERIINLERAFIIREGFSRKQDTLPQRILSEPLHTLGAPGEGQVVRELDTFLNKYYQARGWTKRGIPSRQKINELGLSYLVRDIF
ncbi:aldehyde ferredoxin oxidoreductase family protein [Chloroflexota bacterium]